MIILFDYFQFTGIITHIRKQNQLLIHKLLIDNSIFIASRITHNATITEKLQLKV